jgi:hypothetical protein
MILLFPVEDVFTIAGRGCVIVPGFNSDRHPSSHPRLGNPLRLVRPDGSEIDSRMRGMEMLNPGAATTPLLLSSDIIATEVPIGTHVYWLPHERRDGG